ncbi:hypothetical protein ACSNOI_11335 [Actinomadura kijaniata]
MILVLDERDGDLLGTGEVLPGPAAVPGGHTVHLTAGRVRGTGDRPS